MSDIPSPESMERNMAVSFIQFLRERMPQHNSGFTHSAETAIHCLENAFELNDASYTFQPTVPLFELFTAAEGETQIVAQHRPHTEEIAEANRLKEEGNDLMKSGHYNEALVKYSKAIKLHKDPTYFCNRAAAYSRLEHYALAIQDCRAAIALEPNYSKAYGRMGLTYSCQQRYHEAIKAYKKALELDPHQESYKINMRIAEDKLRERARDMIGRDRRSFEEFRRSFGGDDIEEDEDFDMFHHMMHDHLGLLARRFRHPDGDGQNPPQNE